MLTTSCGDLTFWLKHPYGVWKLRVFLAAGLICTSVQAGDTPQTPLILSLPLAQLALWDTKSTEEYVEQLQGNKEGHKKGHKKQTPWSHEQINHARLLFSRLQKNRIVIKKTFPALLAKTEPMNRSTLCRKCLHYFQHSGPGEISTTGGLTSMFKSQQHIKDFVKRSLSSIRRVARSSPLSAISSIYHHRGFPASSQKVTDFLSWEFWWQKGGDNKILDRKLLRAFSSMFTGRGLPEAQDVEAYLGLEYWWQKEGDKKILDRELLQAFSSMFHGRGLPDARAVETYLDLDIWWQQEGDKRILDRELLRAFSSMFRSRGIPKAQEVKDYLARDVWWQQEGDKTILDRELLRTFSSMFNGRGLPEAQEVKTYLDLEYWWQKQGDRKILDRELLRVFSSMLNGRGVPKVDDVKTYLDLDVWWQQEGGKKILDRELLRAFSSMFSGKGLPKAREVKDYLERDVWWQQEGGNKILDRDLLRAFSLMFSGKGLPDIRQSLAVLDWLSVNGQPDRPTVHLMRRLYSRAYQGHGALGLPDLDRLQEYEQNLCALLQLSLPARDGAEAEDGAGDDALNPVRIKQVALYLANKEGARYLHWTDCVAFLDSLPSGWFRDPLETLHAVLRQQGGGPGVQAWLNIVKAGVAEAPQAFLLRAMVQGMPLATARYAVDHIDQHDWQDYITVTRYFDRCPDGREWTRIKSYLGEWHDILPRRDLQIRYLTLVQRFPGHRRESFLSAESLQSVLKSLPTLQMVSRLAKTCSDNELVAVFQACLDYGQAVKSGEAPSFLTLSTLFHALLKIRSPFYLRPPGPLSGQILSDIEDDPDSGVSININSGAGIQDSETLIWQLLVKMMDGLSAIEYKTGRRRIILHSHGSDSQQTFLIPQLAEGSNGLHIRNWSREDLLRFLRATEWGESLYKPSNSHGREISFPSTRGNGKDISMVNEVKDGRPVYQPRGEQHRPRQNIDRQKTPGEPQLMESPSESVLSLGMLQDILKNQMHLNRHDWQAADFHKTRFSLDILDLLRERAATASRDDVPDTLQEYLARRCSGPESENAGDEAGDLLQLLTQDATVFEPELPPYSVEDFITAACRCDFLSLTALEELVRFREQLTLEQTVQIIQRIPAFAPEAVVSQWTDLQREKMTLVMVQDPLLLCSDGDIWNTLFDDSDD